MNGETHPMDRPGPPCGLKGAPGTNSAGANHNKTGACAGALPKGARKGVNTVRAAQVDRRDISQSSDSGIAQSDMASSWDPGRVEGGVEQR